MKRVVVAIGLAIMLVLFAFGDRARSAGDCENTPSGTVCTSIVGSDVVVTLLGKEIARIPAPIKTVTVKVPVPGPTQLIPGPIQTILVPSPVPGPIRTVYVTSQPVVHSSPVPGPVRTVQGPVVPKLTPTPADATVSTVPSPVVTEAPGVVKFKDKVVRVTIPQAIAISTGFILLGLIIGLLILYMTYHTGEKDGRKFAAQRGREFLRELVNKE